METVFWLVLIAAPFVSFLLWFFFGRDRPIVETIEFYPPEDMTPAEAGLFWDGKTHDREIVSMLLFWADKGIVSIEETGDGDLLIKRKGSLPGDAKQFEEILYRILFLRVNTVSANFFGDEIRIAIDDAKSALLREYGSESIKSLYDLRSLEMRILVFIIALLPLIFNFIIISFLRDAALDVALYEGTVGFFSINGLAAVPVILVAISMIRFAKRLLFQAHSGSAAAFSLSKAVILSPLFIIGILLFIILGASYFDTPLHVGFSVLSTILCTVIAVNMPKRTVFYSRILGRVRGFANFIRTAELDRMKMLINDDPNYYSKILPYAWAMGMSGTLGIQLDRIGEGVTPPHWYRSENASTTFSYSSMTRSLNRGFGNIKEE